MSRVRSPTAQPPPPAGPPARALAAMMSRTPEPESLRVALEAAGRRCTPQRLAVFEALGRASHHPTAEEVYESVRGVLPKISLATVYKALEAFVSGGLAAKLAG